MWMETKAILGDWTGLVCVVGGAVAGTEGSRASPNVGISRSQGWETEGAWRACVRRAGL